MEYYKLSIVFFLIETQFAYEIFQSAIIILKFYHININFHKKNDN